MEMKDFCLNDVTEKGIWNYLKATEKGSIVLHGPRHMGKHLCARLIARSVLGVDSDEALFSHPDFTEVTLDKKSSIGIEQIRVILEQAEFCPVLSAKRVMLIDDADAMTVAAQNALLKVLEDDADRVIFVFVAHNKLLSTICSRCTTIVFKPVPVSCENTVLEVLANGCPGAIRAYADSSLLRKAEEVIALHEHMADRRELLKTLGQVKEKDQGEFFSMHDTGEVMAFLCFYEYLFSTALLWQYKQGDVKLKQAVEGIVIEYSEKEILCILDCLRVHKGQLLLGTYNKNDFFNFCLLIGGK